MSALRFQLLGPPLVSVDGQPLRFRSKKVLGLVVYLALTETAHDRHVLASMFWPDSEPSKAANSLRASLSRARKTLADAGLDPIVADRTAVRFDEAQDVDIDLLDLQRLATDQGADLRELDACLLASRGTPMEGLSLDESSGFTDWLTSLRHEAQVHVDAVGERLVRGLLETGRPSDAVAAAELWTNLAGLSEPAHLALVEALVSSGSPAGAGTAWRLFEDRMLNELGLEPDPDARTAAQRFIESPRVGSGSAASVDERRPALPFIGREEEFGALVAIWNDVVGGSSRTVTVEGEAGIGKSRLVDEFVNWASLQPIGVTILRSRAYDVGEAPALQPVTDAIRRVLQAERSPADLLSDVWLGELAQLLPELHERYPDLPDRELGEVDFQRSRLREAIAVLGLSLADRGPVLWSIDDLHRADTETIGALNYVARRWRELEIPVLIVATMRPDPDVRLGDRATRLELAEIDETAIRDLLFGDTAEVASVASLLFARTGGLPLFLEATLGDLADRELIVSASPRPDLVDAAATWSLVSRHRLGVPKTVTELIQDVVRRLDAPARALASAVAVVGVPTDLDALGAMCDLDGATTLGAVEALLDARLVSTGENGDVQPRHDLVRDALSELLTAPRRRELHRRAVSVLSSAPPGRMAHHALAAGLLDEAFGWLVKAAVDAAVVHATDVAAEHAIAAVGLLNAVKGSEESMLALCRIGGRQLEVANRFSDALDLYSSLLSAADRIGSTPLRSAALLGAARVRAMPIAAGDLGRALSDVETVLEIAGAVGDESDVVTALWIRMNVLSRLDEKDAALAAGLAAEQRAHEAGLTEQLAFVVNDLALLMYATGRWHDAEARALEAAGLWRGLNDRPMLVEALNLITNVRINRGQLDGVRDPLEEAGAVSAETGNAWSQTTTLFNHALFELAFGDDEAALAALESVATRGGEIQLASSQVIAHSFMTLVHLRVGAHAAAADAAREAMSLVDGPLVFLEPLARGATALAALGRGDVTAADAALDGVTVESGSIDWTFLSIPELASAGLHVAQRSAEAPHVVSELQAAWDGVGSVLLQRELDQIAAGLAGRTT